MRCALVVLPGHSATCGSKLFSGIADHIGDLDFSPVSQITAPFVEVSVVILLRFAIVLRVAKQNQLCVAESRHGYVMRPSGFAGHSATCGSKIFSGITDHIGDLDFSPVSQITAPFVEVSMVILRRFAIVLCPPQLNFAKNTYKGAVGNSTPDGTLAYFDENDQLQSVLILSLATGPSAFTPTFSMK
ncbi:unnamed protein product [Fraxinus pennsylvanica]|uniref:Uncharacterized protein n=1 Tax=Fraxinus pennsylvanica TaxID=56036 RepID=A0AAD1ZSV2_9LAMI|nr:unnamed protein product [Fraxinus pennsylvanica]